MHIQFKKDRLRLGPICLGMLTLILMAMVCPGVSGSSSEAQAAEGDVPVSAGGDNISISISKGRVDLTANPTAGSVVVQDSLDISVQTTNLRGYVLELNVSNTNMKSVDTSNSATIPTLASATTLANFPDNRWGYYFGPTEATNDAQFQPFSTVATAVDETSEPNTIPRTKRLTVAAKIGGNIPASTYAGNIIISAVAFAPVWTSSITTMQEMTSSVCSSLQTGAEKQLTDTRDSQTYWVGKMKDGHCWMLQNLALGKTTGSISLTSSNSNVSSSWTLPRAYASTVNGSQGQNGAQSLVWNLGKVVSATPLLTENCGYEASPTLASCVKVGFIDVSNASKFQPTFEARNMAWDGANAQDNTLVAVNCTSWSGSGETKTCTAGTYDAHYLVGNYYTWNAATAGTGASAPAHGNASGSICPKGWRLPAMDDKALSTKYTDYYYLLDAYGVSSNAVGSNYNISGYPLRFVRSGDIYPTTSDGSIQGYAGGVGSSGYYLMSDATGSSSSLMNYMLQLRNDEIKTNEYWHAGFGRSVRCIAQ